MSSFTAHIQTETVDKTTIRLLRDVTYYLAVPQGPSITAPAGMTCDGASIPRLAWPIVGHPLEGDILAAALIHDACYRAEATSTPPGLAQRITRKQADRNFHDGLLVLGCTPWRARLMYWAVRVGGHWAWRH